MEGGREREEREREGGERKRGRREKEREEREREGGERKRGRREKEREEDEGRELPCTLLKVLYFLCFTFLYTIPLPPSFSFPSLPSLPLSYLRLI